jgi:arylsulfatase
MTIAEFLRAKGYETYAIVGHTYVSRKFRFDRGFGHYDDNAGQISTADELTKVAIQLLKKKRNNKQFFLWLHYREPHSPYAPPLKYIQIFSKNGPINEENTLETYTIYGTKLRLSKENIRNLINLYDANIRFVDDNLRELFAYLKQSDLLRKSIIIITADHGESLGEHNIFDHNELYYNILRVPLIIRIPNVRGNHICYPVALVDIFPTISELVGEKYISKLKQFRGESVFHNEKLHRELFSEYSDRTSLIFDNFRLFRNAKGEYELYDINSDPAELDNLVSKDQSTLHLLKQKMNSFLQFSKCPAATDKFLLDTDTQESLKSLGYIQ